MTLNMHTLTFDRLSTPLGDALLVTDSQQRLRALDWQGYEARLRRLLRMQSHDTEFSLVPGKAPAELRERLNAYFAGSLQALDAVAVCTSGTAFQREVWDALRLLRPAQTVSYGELARRIGRPNASRAVGLANATNPIAVVVPCHRVIGADGSLTGYAGGLARKRWLLAHERASVTRPVVREQPHETARI